MKTILHTVLLSTAIILTGNVISQQEIKTEDKFQIDQNQESVITIDDITNPHYNSEYFKALIFPNPTFTSKVKMTWQDDQNVDQILLMRVGWDDVREINIEHQKEITVDGLLEGFYYVKFFYNNELLATQKLTVIKE